MFTLELTHSGWWPRARVAWLAPDEESGVLLTLASNLRDMAVARGIEMEQRPYSPHLTIARKVRRRPPAQDFAPIRWEINEFCLMESSAGDGGSEYRILHRWPLKGG